MEDRTWESAKEPWQRVQWARERSFDSMAAAAKAMNLSPETYRQYERAPGTSRTAKLNEEYARKFARKFRTNWVWLLTGAGQPTNSDDERAMELVEIFSELGEEQKRLLIDLARNMARPASNVITVDALPSPPSAGSRSRAQRA